MAFDLRIVVPNRPGTTARAFELLAEEGINIEGVCGDLRPGETWGFIHILVDDGERTQELLEGMGLQISSMHQVDVVAIENRPGALVEAVRRYSDADQNIEVLYIASDNRLVVGTEAMREARPGVRVEDARYR